MASPKGIMCSGRSSVHRGIRASMLIFSRGTANARDAPSCCAGNGSLLLLHHSSSGHIVEPSSRPCSSLCPTTAPRLHNELDAWTTAISRPKQPCPLKIPALRNTIRSFKQRLQRGGEFSVRAWSTSGRHDHKGTRLVAFLPRALCFCGIPQNTLVVTLRSRPECMP